MRVATLRGWIVVIFITQSLRNFSHAPEIGSCRDPAVLRACRRPCPGRSLPAHFACRRRGHVFNIDGYGFHDLADNSGHTAFDITWRALIDYSGSGDYASAGDQAVDLTIAINGQPAQTSTINGLFFVDRSNFSSTPDAGTALVTQSLIVMPMWWGNGLSFRQAMAFSLDLASDPGSLPAHLPAGASSGRIE